MLLSFHSTDHATGVVAESNPTPTTLCAVCGGLVCCSRVACVWHLRYPSSGCLQIRASVRQGLKSIIAKVGVTSILVTHDQEEAFDLADQVVIFNR